MARAEPVLHLEDASQAARPAPGRGARAHPPRHGDLQNRKLKFPDTGQWRQSDVTFASTTSRRVDANLLFLGGVEGVWRQGTLTSIDANLTRLRLENPYKIKGFLSLSFIHVKVSTHFPET